MANLIFQRKVYLGSVEAAVTYEIIFLVNLIDISYMLLSAFDLHLLPCAVACRGVKINQCSKYANSTVLSLNISVSCLYFIIKR